MKPRIVILGAGFAGLSVARQLARADAEVVLVDRRNHHLFQALLYQVASSGLSPAEVATPIRLLFRRQRNVKVLMADVTGVDMAGRRIELNGGEQHLDYDYLVVAVGARTSYFGNDGWAAHAPGLKTLGDAIRIRQSLLQGFERAELAADPAERRRLMTVVVVGAGPTGVELAGAFAELRRHVLRWDFRSIQAESARVVLLEAGERVLPGFTPALSESARATLEGLGVEVRTSERVLDVGERRLVTDRGLLEAETIVWTAGVRANPLAAQLSGDLDRGGRVPVTADLRVPGQERVYCLGDLARFEQDGQPLPGVAPVAMAQGIHSGRNLVRQLAGEEPLPFHFAEREHIATLGRSQAVFQWKGLQLSGTPAWLAWLWLHLFRIADLQNRVLVFTRWTWSYFTWKWGVRLIVPEEGGEDQP